MNRPKHLIIPDPHAHYQYDNFRFDILGQFILDERPDVIICIGDMADMPSLSSYDKGKKSFEGRRLKADIAATIDAQERLFGPVRKYNARRAKNKEKQYKPRWVMCMGNHEDRLNRAANDSSELDGLISTDLLRYQDFGWEVHDFLEPVIIDGIAYAHYFTSGVMARPISGENIGKTLCGKQHMSSVQGHSHVFDHSERARIDGQKVFGLSCGCFTHPDYIENWNRSTVHMWWRGIVILDEVDGAGYYDELRAITLRKLMRDYA